MTLEARKQAQYQALSQRLKRLAGSEFETYHHPAVILDRATGPEVRVWGWWSGGDSELPCMLWAGDLGWSATVVEPDAFDTEGYERVFWSHRIKLLDLALANCLGPSKTLEDLELRVAGDPTNGLDASWADLQGGLLWGVVQLRAARAHRGRIVGGGAGVRPLSPTAGMPGSFDEELARHGLLPTLPKSRMPSGSADLLTRLAVVRPLSEAAVSSGTAYEE
jgi:hypothetical protein